MKVDLYWSSGVCVVHDAKTKEFYYLRVGNIIGIQEGVAMKMTLANIVAYECTPTQYKADLVEATVIDNLVVERRLPICDINAGQDIFGVLAVNGMKDRPVVEKGFKQKGGKQPPRTIIFSCNGKYGGYCGSCINNH